MQCPNCGSDNQQDRFCTVCGAAIPVGQSPAQPVAPPPATPPQQPPVQYAAQPVAGQPLQPPAAKKRGCGCYVIGCLGVLVVIALAITLSAGWYLRWPERWGLVESPATKLFEPSPNPWAAEALEEEFVDGGMSVEGLTFYVLPVEDGTTQVVYVLAEEAEGFTWSHPTFENPIEGLLYVTAASEATVEYSIERVAVDYRDADGVQVAVMTAPTEALVARVLGEISEGELFDQMNGTVPDPSPLDIDLGGGQ